MRPAIPRKFQLLIRRSRTKLKKKLYEDVWPINPEVNGKPAGWPGWPDGKKFAFVLTHDVETHIGHDRCRQLAKLEMELGFRSSFNFVPERYKVSPELRKYLNNNGFEVGVHGLYHDGRLYFSRDEFRRRATKINKYIEEWHSKGFRSPAMHHNLDWIHDLDILYDASTFDFDPFEPQSDGMETLFPFYVANPDSKTGYVELPYTLPQDSTLYLLLGETDISIWSRKLEWVVEHGGMALFITHPDYMAFGNHGTKIDEFPVDLYTQFLKYVKQKYSGQYWQVLPHELASYYRSTLEINP